MLKQIAQLTVMLLLPLSAFAQNFYPGQKITTISHHDGIVLAVPGNGVLKVQINEGLYDVLEESAWPVIQCYQDLCEGMKVKVKHLGIKGYVSRVYGDGVALIMVNGGPFFHEIKNLKIKN